MKDHISNTKLEKGDHYKILHSNKAQGSFFSLKSYSKKTLRKKCPEKRSKIQTKCTPYVELIQYGRHIGKKIYWPMADRCVLSNYPRNNCGTHFVNDKGRSLT